ncbi:hypothetical protein V490_03298 [Pseudogymnoascus sp. VKM F-3557]|nr:hypothetical protein V490_03298 [Pseudogymnoascus sp. VKM F-3557]
MHFTTALISALLPLAVLANPLAASPLSHEDAQALKTSDIQTRDDAAEAAGLVKRNRFCDVVNVSTTVDCWFLPKHKGNQNRIIRSFKGTTNDIEFACWTKCENVNGITTWFWTWNAGTQPQLNGCYVPGYYLDNNCVSSGSGALPQCEFAAVDRSYGGCA